MVVIPIRKMLFIHIPCTSGTTVTSALLQGHHWNRLWDGWMLPGNGDLFHMTARDSKRWFDGFGTFTIIRNPWRCIESIWRRFTDAGINSQKYPTWSDPFVAYCKSLLTTSFVDFIKEFFASRPGGFYRHWCDDGTTVFRYEDKPYEDIAKFLDLPLQFKVLNVNSSPHPQWTQEAVDLIGDFCKCDIKTFGYDYYGTN